MADRKNVIIDSGFYLFLISKSLSPMLVGAVIVLSIGGLLPGWIYMLAALVVGCYMVLNGAMMTLGIFWLLLGHK